MHQFVDLLDAPLGRVGLVETEGLELKFQKKITNFLIISFSLLSFKSS